MKDQNDKPSPNNDAALGNDAPLAAKPSVRAIRTKSTAGSNKRMTSSTISTLASSHNTTSQQTDTESRNNVSPSSRAEGRPTNAAATMENNNEVAAADIQPENLTYYFDKQSNKFPCLFSYMPRFSTVGIEHQDVSNEPIAISLHMKQYSHKWTVIVTYPGSKEPYGSRSINVFFDYAEEFADLGCQVFPLSGDTYSMIRKFRDVSDSGKNNTKSITFLTDNAQHFIGKKFDVLTKKKNGDYFYYPGYFIFTPDRELVQFGVVRNSDKLFERNEDAFFCYPFTKEVADSITQTIKQLQPMYDSVRILRLTFPRANFGSFVANMIYRVQTEATDEEAMESIFSWKGWGQALCGAFKGGLH